MGPQVSLRSPAPASEPGAIGFSATSLPDETRVGLGSSLRSPGATKQALDSAVLPSPSGRGRRASAG